MDGAMWKSSIINVVYIYIFYFRFNLFYTFDTVFLVIKNYYIDCIPSNLFIFDFFNWSIADIYY